VFARPQFLFFQHNHQCDTLLPIVPCTHKLKAGIAYFVGDFVFPTDANDELVHKSIESFFRSKQFQVFCMSFIRGGEKSPTE
jgi:hypothetical protein